MPKKIDPLGALEIKRLNAPGRHATGIPGLYLVIRPGTLTKSWVFRTVVAGDRRDYGLGGYPGMSLAQATERARDMRDSIGKGEDPLAAKKAAQVAAVQTFKKTALECIESHRAAWKSSKHAAQWTATLEAYVFPHFGGKAVKAVDTADVLKALQPIWQTKNETATRVRQRIEKTLAFAAAAGYRERGLNPAQWKGHMDQLLAAPSKVAKVIHHPAVKLDDLPDFTTKLRAIEGMSARCLEFVLWTAARSGEARLATWAEVDMEQAVWCIPGERMKAGKPHRVPLSAQALRLLKSLPRTEPEPGQPNFIFPGARPGRPLSDMALGMVMRRMDVQAVPHGLRSSFRDWAGDRTSYSRDAAELALAHTVKDDTEAAYRRGDMLEKRRPMMEDWATFCTTQPGGAVVPIKAKRKAA